MCFLLLHGEKFSTGFIQETNVYQHLEAATVRPALLEPTPVVSTDLAMVVMMVMVAVVAMVVVATVMAVGTWG